MKTEEFRAQFPGLKREVYGKSLVYLDNAATSLRPESVAKMQCDLALNHNANIHRAVHKLSAEATDIYEESREVVRVYINAKDKKEIIFTSGTTFSINLVANSFADAFIHEGDEIIVSQAEHHSNLLPWQFICHKKSAVLKMLPVDERGELRLDLLPELIGKRTKLLALCHISNVLGIVNPIKKAIEIAHERGVKVLIDGAQGILHCPVDVQDLDCDFYCFSGHKIFASTASGILYGKEELLNAMPPFLGGGEMVGTVNFRESTFAPLPYKFEAGTQNINGTPTLIPALELLKQSREGEVKDALEKIKLFVYQALKSNKRVHLYGDPINFEDKIALFSFTVEGAHHEDLALILDKMGIALRSGYMCAEPLVNRMGCTGMLRASFAAYNTMPEAEYFISSLDKAIAMLI